MIEETLGHYRITASLGAGGMGEVYRARDQRLDRDVALKVLPQGMDNDTERMARFEREAKAIAAINHPNIVTIYSVEEDRGRKFITMEVVDGVTLDQFVPVSEGLSVKDFHNIAAPLAEALVAAHERGIVHRDIKGANIMIARGGRPVILDFGLAQLPNRTRLTLEETTVGTVAYMAPEQAAGGEVDHRCDLWALGVCMYMMLSGRLPFHGEHEQATVYQILNREPEPLPERVPTAIRTCVRRCLQKSREDRYMSARDLLADLRQAQSDPTVTIAKPSKRKPSIAVLAFDNMSGDQGQEYLCDGIAEDIIHALTRVEGLRVAARTSAFSFKGRRAAVQEVGEQLNVATVLEGSVQRAGDRLRVTVQLIEVASGYHMWSERFDRQIDDVFAIQDEITAAVVERLKLDLLGEAPIAARHTDEIHAYEAYMQGRFLWNRRTQDAIDEAITHFERAIEIDPDYALAYVGLADCMVIFAFYSYRAPKDTFPVAKKAVMTALEKTESLADAHVTHGYCNLYYDWDWTRAYESFQKGIELNPAYPLAHLWMANCHVARGRFEDALRAMYKSRELDPLSLVANQAIAWGYYFKRDYERAVAESRRVQQMDPTYVLPHLWCGWALEHLKRYDEAIEQLDVADQNAGGVPLTRAFLARAKALAGNRKEARSIQQSMHDQASERYISSYLMAMVSLGLGDRDEAFKWLNRAYGEREHWLVFLDVDPRLDAIRNDSRFDKLIEKVGVRS